MFAQVRKAWDSVCSMPGCNELTSSDATNIMVLGKLMPSFLEARAKFHSLADNGVNPRGGGFLLVRETEGNYV